MRKRNFASVARDRNTNPATVSRSIAALEKELNARLFQRTTRRVEPTEAAELYFARIEPLVCELNNAKLLIADAHERVQGVLRFSCPVSFAQLNITPLLPEFSALYPELDYELVFTDTILDLIGERLDAAIRIGTLSDSNLIAHKLAPMVARVLRRARISAKIRQTAQTGRFNQTSLSAARTADIRPQRLEIYGQTRAKKKRSRSANS